MGLLERATATCLTVRVITSVGLFCVSERIISAPERCDPLACTHTCAIIGQRGRETWTFALSRGGGCPEKNSYRSRFPLLFVPPSLRRRWMVAGCCVRGRKRGNGVKAVQSPRPRKNRGDLSTATVPLLSGGGASWRKSPRTRTEKGGERGRRKRTWKSGIFFSTASHLMQWREGGRFSDMKTGLGKRVMKLPPPPPLVIAVRKLPNSRAIPSFY